MTGIVALIVFTVVALVVLRMTVDRYEDDRSGCRSETCAYETP